MTEHEVVPQYRYRGSVKPSAEVSRPVAVHRHAPQAVAGDAFAPAETSATLDIFDVIDSYGGWWGVSSRDVDAALAQIGDVDTLYVRINSPGGEATEGVAIANLLRAHPASVRCTVYGMAASAASIIAVAGETLNMAPGSTLMIHDASGFAYGDVVAMQASFNALNAISDGYAGLYALKAGGTSDEWRALMRDTTWYTPETAVAAKLADHVGLDPSMPGDLPDVEDDEDDDSTVLEIEIELNPAARAAARRSDFALLPPAAHAATKTPAAPPVAPSTDPKEADAMSDTLLDGLRKQLGLSDDADEATVLAANAEALTEKADTPAAPTLDEAARAAALAALKDEGKVVVSTALLDTLKHGAEAGQAALARQHAEDRDKAIAAAQAAGKLGRGEDTVKAWAAAWDKDPAGTAKELDELGVRFPTAELPGVAGNENHASAEPWSDDEADALAGMAGLPKGSLR